MYVFQRAYETLIIRYHIRIERLTLFYEYVVTDDEFTGALMQAVTYPRSQAVIAYTRICK